MDIDIPGALHELGVAADRLEALLEWDELAQQERGSSALPPFHFRDHNRNDIFDLFSAFFNLSMSVHAVLEHGAFDLPAEERAAWTHRLRALDDRVGSMGIMERFIKL